VRASCSPAWGLVASRGERSTRANLSGGRAATRVAIARAAGGGPPRSCCSDEPRRPLDPEAGRRGGVEGVMARAGRPRGPHDDRRDPRGWSSPARCRGHCVFLHQGRIEEEGHPREILAATRGLSRLPAVPVRVGSSRRCLPAGAVARRAAPGKQRPAGHDPPNATSVGFNGIDPHPDRTLVRLCSRPTRHTTRPQARQPLPHDLAPPLAARHRSPCSASTLSPPTPRPPDAKPADKPEVGRQPTPPGPQVDGPDRLRVPAHWMSVDVSPDGPAPGCSTCWVISIRCRSPAARPRPLTHSIGLRGCRRAWSPDGRAASPTFRRRPGWRRHRVDDERPTGSDAKAVTKEDFRLPLHAPPGSPERPSNIAGAQATSPASRSLRLGRDIWLYHGGRAAAKGVQFEREAETWQKGPRRAPRSRQTAAYVYFLAGHHARHASSNTTRTPTRRYSDNPSASTCGDGRRRRPFVTGQGGAVRPVAVARRQSSWHFVAPSVRQTRGHGCVS